MSFSAVDNMNTFHLKCQFPFNILTETMKYRFVYGFMKINRKYIIFTQIMQSAILSYRIAQTDFCMSHTVVHKNKFYTFKIVANVIDILVVIRKISFKTDLLTHLLILSRVAQAP